MKALPPAKEQSREEKLRAALLFYARGSGRSAHRAFAQFMELIRQEYPGPKTDDAAGNEEVGPTNLDQN